MDRNNLYDRLRFDIGFLIGKISKSEMNALRGNDYVERDRVKYQIGERIAARLRQSYNLEPIGSDANGAFFIRDKAE